MKKDLERSHALGIAEDFLARTKDLYKRSAIAGSLRRKEPVVHDVDIAVMPKVRDFALWKQDLTKRVEEIGGQVITFGEVITNFTYRGLQVNLFLCRHDKEWGVTLMWATGPKGHTIGMTIKARDKGLLINSEGIWTREQPPRLVEAKTEHDVGRILGWKYKRPEERGKGSNKEPEAY